MVNKKDEKSLFIQKMLTFIETLNEHTTTKDGQWSIKGFIDIYKNIYTISSDTKIVSKILEIHIFPELCVDVCAQLLQRSAYT